MVIVRLLARLDRLVSTAHADSEQRSRDALLGALLSALADPAQPLTGVRGCAQALHMTLNSHGEEEELTANARDLVREAARRPLAAATAAGGMTRVIVLPPTSPVSDQLGPCPSEPSPAQWHPGFPHRR